MFGYEFGYGAGPSRPVVPGPSGAPHAPAVVHGPNWHRRRLQQNPDLGVWPGMTQPHAPQPGMTQPTATGMIPGGDPRYK